MKIPLDPLKLVPIVTGVFKSWNSTIRYEPHGDWDALREMNQQGVPLVASMWHGEIFPITGFAYDRGFNLFVIISQSKDGEFIARFLDRLGVGAVRGSSSRGGVKALLQGKRYMEKEKSMAVFTVDGPRGPRHEPKDGVIFLAQQAGAKIVPVRAFPEKSKVFDKSWDRFKLPLPFTRCPVYLGEPMEVTKEKLDKNVLDREKERLKARMLALGTEE